MEQHRDSVTGVIRPTWQGDDLQEKVLAEIVKAFGKARADEDTAWQQAQRGREAGIPDTVICQRAEVTRSTLNRKLGARPKAVQ